MYEEIDVIMGLKQAMNEAAGNDDIESGILTAGACILGVSEDTVMMMIS